MRKGIKIGIGIALGFLLVQVVFFLTVALFALHGRGTDHPTIVTPISTR